MAIGGLLLRFGSTGLRVLELGASAVALGIFSYFLAVLAHHDLPIANKWKAVEGISGAGCLYTIFGVLLTCFLGGITFFGFIAVVLDILFVGAFIAVAIMTRDGAGSCRGYVNTPLGNGYNYLDTVNGHTLHYACTLNTAVFAVAIINCFLFALTAAVQVFLVRHHKKDKRYGPGPDNNYTSGRGKFWQRKRKVHNTRDAELATALPGTTVHDNTTTVRPSGDTGFTGSTVNTGAHTHEPKYGQPGYGQAVNY